MKKINFISQILKANFERLIIHTQFLMSFFFEKLFNNFKKLPDDWEQSLESLRKNGLTKIPIKLSDEFKEFVKNKTTKEIYYELFNDNKFLTFNGNTNNESNSINPNEYGIGSYGINHKSPLIKEIINDTLISFIRRYYGKRTFWIRNSPIIRFDEESSRKKNHSQKNFHLDWGVHQLSLIILLNKTNSDSTCTEIIPKTHKNFRFGYEFFKWDSVKFMKYVQKKLSTNNSQKIFGDMFTAYLIDAGNTLHKGNYGKDRLMMHFNFVTSKSYISYEDPKSKVNQLKYFGNTFSKNNIISDIYY